MKTTFLTQEEFSEMYSKYSKEIENIKTEVYSSTIHSPQKKMQMSDNINVFLQISIKKSSDEKLIKLMNARTQIPVFALTSNQVKQLNMHNSWSGEYSRSCLVYGFILNNELFIKTNYADAEIINP